MRAEIDLVSTTPEELSSLTATIAPQEAYAVQGMERRAIHGAIQIDVAKKPDGSPVLKLTTRQPVEEPFLDMLIQVDWATGRLLREYTVLLDPPGYDVSQPLASVTTAVSDTAAESAPPAKSSTTSESGIRPVESVAPDAQSRYVTKTGDTLSKIARQMQVEGISLDQMLVGLYRVNKEAFDGGNMNRLKVGQIIRAPSLEELTAVDPQEAAREVKVQTADWNAYRNRLAAVVAESQPAADAGDQAASGRLKTAAEDKALPAEDGPRDVVKLSRSETNAADAESRQLQDRLAAAQEESIARQKSVEEANERIAMLEKQIADLQSLLTIKDQTLASLQQAASELGAETTPAENDTPAIAETAEPTPVPVEPQAEETAASATPQAEETVEKPKPPRKKAPAPVPAEPPGLLDALSDNALLVGLAGGAVLLLSGGWLFIRNRRKRNLDNFEQGILTAGGLKANTVFGNTAGGTVDTGDTSFLTNFSQSPSGMIDTHDVDPIAEAEVYMAYGRDTQAEEILNDAIAKDPTRYELHLKLLEIFVARNDTSAFEAVAGELYSTLGSAHPVWKQVAEMGHKLEPSNPLYDTDNLPAASTAPVAEEVDQLAQTTIVNASSEVSRLDASDFEDAEVMSGQSLDFSLDDTTIAATDDADDAAAKPVDNSLDFDLGFAAEEATAQTEATPSADLALGEPVEDKPSQDAGGLDFNMDFTLGEDTAGAEIAQPEAAPVNEDTVQLETPDFGSTLPQIEVPTLSFDAVPSKDGDDESDTVSDLADTIELSLPADSGTVQTAPVEADETPGLDFNLDLNAVDEIAGSVGADGNVDNDGALELDLSAISLDLGDSPQQAAEADAGPESEPEEVDTKLDLVTAYMDMGDSEGARELLEEVLREGGPKQRQRAQELFASLS
ncbi:MAG TPA: FimV/HubP family polar landmark protein [Methylophilaceae bacterium]